MYVVYYVRFGHTCVCPGFEGKSLYIRRMYEELKVRTRKASQLKCIRLIEPRVDENAVLQSMLNTPKEELTIFHFDVTSSVSNFSF